eukprot:Em0002g1087a
MKSSSDEIVVKYCDVQWQKEGSDCELFAIAFAFSLCCGIDPTTVRFEQEKMRPHLIKCLETKTCSMFPSNPIRKRANLVPTVLAELHDSPTAGHLGVGKVLEKVRRRFYWVGQRRDVQGWCDSCSLCGSTKSPPKHRHAPLQADVSTTPMQRVAMDILGPLPLTPRSNKYVLVIGDYCTKWTEAFAIPDMETVTVARVFVNEFVSRVEHTEEAGPSQQGDVPARETIPPHDVNEEMYDMVVVPQNQAAQLAPADDETQEPVERNHEDPVEEVGEQDDDDDTDPQQVERSLCVILAAEDSLLKGLDVGLFF